MQHVKQAVLTIESLVRDVQSSVKELAFLLHSDQDCRKLMGDDYEGSTLQHRLQALMGARLLYLEDNIEGEGGFFIWFEGFSGNMENPKTARQASNYMDAADMEFVELIDSNNVTI